MSRSRALWLGVLSMVPTLGCAHNPAPPAWRVSPLEAASRPRGAWIELTLRSDPQRPTVAGELLAIDQEGIHVLTMSGAVTALRRDVIKVAIGVHKNHRSDATAWTWLGALSTLSHGYYLALTAPLLWAVGGGFATAHESHIGVAESLRDARKYSRFPQGLPEGLDLATMPPLAGIGPPGSHRGRPDAFIKQYEKARAHANTARKTEKKKSARKK